MRILVPFFMALLSCSEKVRTNCMICPLENTTSNSFSAFFTIASILFIMPSRFESRTKLAFSSTSKLGACAKCFRNVFVLVFNVNTLSRNASSSILIRRGSASSTGAALSLVGVPNNFSTNPNFSSFGNIL